MSRQLIEVGERVDRRLEAGPLLDRSERGAHAREGVRVLAERALHFRVERRIHQERASAGDVEQQCAKRRLELPLLVLVDERPDHTDGQEGHPDEQPRGADAQPLPGAKPEWPGRRWAPGRHWINTLRRRRQYIHRTLKSAKIATNIQPARGPVLSVVQAKPSVAANDQRILSDSSSR